MVFVFLCYFMVFIIIINFIISKFFYNKFFFFKLKSVYPSFIFFFRDYSHAVIMLFFFLIFLDNWDPFCFGYTESQINQFHDCFKEDVDRQWLECVNSNNHINEEAQIECINKKLYFSVKNCIQN